MNKGGKPGGVASVNTRLWKGIYFTIVEKLSTLYTESTS